MQIFVYLAILFGVLGQLVKIPLGSGNLYPLDLLVIFTVTLWVIFKLIERDYRFKIPHYFFPLLFFLFWALITLVRGKADVTSSDFITGAFYFIRFVFYTSFSLVVYDLKVKSDRKLSKEDSSGTKKPASKEEFTQRVEKVLIASSVLVALTGFIQLVVYPDLSKLAFEFGYDPHKNRLVSTFLDPNFTAAYLALGIALLFSLIGRVKGISKYWYVLWSVLLFTALIFTFSRSGWIMFSAVLLLFGFLRSPKLLVVAFFAGFLAYFAVPRVQTRISGITDPDDSAKLRLISWSRALDIFSENSIFGVGFNLYRPAQERFGFFDPSMGSTSSPQVDSGQDIGGHAGAGSDSSLLLVLATTGVVGFVLFLLLKGYIFMQSLKRRQTVVGLALAMSLFGLLFDSQFINSLFFPQIMLWIWVLVGLSY